jgi:hypothetical protein
VTVLCTRRQPRSRPPAYFLAKMFLD